MSKPVSSAEYGGCAERLGAVSLAGRDGDEGFGDARPPFAALARPQTAPIRFGGASPLPLREFAQAGGLGGRRRQSPEVEEPVGGEIVAEFEGLRIIAPELLADAVGEPVAVLLEVLGHARPLAQLDHDRVFGREPAEAMPVGSQGVGEHVGIAAIVLGDGDGE